MPDGLGMLDQQRQRRSRSIPTPRNPPRSTPVDVVELTPRPVADQKPDPEPVSETKPESQAPNVVIPEPTIKMSIYLDHSDDQYLEEITHAGKTSRPRVAISRSAIVRLALERLASDTTVDEIVEQLRKAGDEHQGRGRKRR